MELSPQTIALKPNSALLDPNFSGYKLNLDKIASHSKQVNGVLQAAEPPGSYSYQQVRLHALHNHLWEDTWLPNRCFFFAADGVLNQVQAVPPSAGGRAGVQLESAPVLQLPDASGAAAGAPLHPSLSLTSDQMALVSDGRGSLHVAQTGDRSAAHGWQICFSDVALEGRGFVLLHSLLAADGDLHVLTGHVAEAASVPDWRGDADHATFLHVLTWLQYKRAEGVGWSLARQRQAATSGTVHYACIEANGGALCVAADRAVRYTRDSARPLPEEAAPPPTMAAAAAAAGPAAAPDDAEAMDTATASAPAPAPPLYVWSQTADDVTVQLTVAAGATPHVVLESHALTVTVAGEPLLRGALPAGVKIDESTWTADDGRVEVVLAKAASGELWRELLVGDTRGQQEADPEMAAAAAGKLPALGALQGGGDEEMATYNAAELDVCDDFPEEGALLVRLDGETRTATHQADLSGHQYILTVQLSAGAQPALCIRHDVDALLWQPRADSAAADAAGRWRCEHVGTLNAFGFVQASKTERKFLTCAPDRSYAVIVDTSRHLFIYHQRPAPVAGELRNRNSGQRVAEVSRQQVVNLDDLAPILGVSAACGLIYVLTADRLHALRLD